MRKIYFLASIIAFLLSSGAYAQIYVTESGAGAKNGTSWANAYDKTDLQTAINNAVNTTERVVWVAKGTYTPTESLSSTGMLSDGTTPVTARDNAFVLKSSVKIFGGFTGTESIDYDLSLRDFTVNETILSGDLDGNDIAGENDPGYAASKTDNAYHVVAMLSVSMVSQLDGFTISGGYADGAGSIKEGDNALSQNVGGGFAAFWSGANSDIVLKNLHIKNNYSSSTGGGAYLYGGGTTLLSVTMLDVIFEANKSNTNGGGAWVRNTGINVSQSTFKDNVSVGRAGGLYIYNGININIANTVFDSNKGATAGALSNFIGTIYVDRCLFKYNYAETTGGAFLASSTTTANSGSISYISNSVFYKNHSNDPGTASNGGSAIFQTYTSPGISTGTYTNNIFYGNTSVNGNGPISFYSNVAVTMNIYNNIFSENVSNMNSGSPIYADIRRVTGAKQDIQNNILATAITNSGQRTVEGNYVLDGSEPLFASTDELNPDFLKPALNSFAIDKGNSSLYNNDLLVDKDYAGNARLGGVAIDLGAYETQGAIVSTIRYVSETGAGDKSGDSWANASDNIQNIINLSSAADEVWVAKGTYFPTEKLDLSSVDDRDKAFILKANVKIYGGFSGGEISLNNRDFVVNETILSGDLGVLNDASDNAYHIVTARESSIGAVLDGFSIEKGNANGAEDLVYGGVTYSRANGGGIFLTGGGTSANFKNLLIRKNASVLSGAGYYTYGDGFVNSVYNFENIKFIENESEASGAAMYIRHGLFNLKQVTLENNISTATGGAIYLYSGIANIDQSSFINNQSGSSGGAIFNYIASLTISRTKFYNNSAVVGGGAIYASSSSVTTYPTTVINNSVFSKNTSDGTGTNGAGAVYINTYGEGVITNSTFYQNVSNGTSYGAITFNNASNTRLTLINNIFSENMGDNEGIAIYADMRRSFTVNGNYSNNLFQASMSSSINTIVANTFVLDEISPEPLFVSTDENDPDFLKLSSNSFALEKGNNGLYNSIVGNLSSDKDLSGIARLSSAAVDLGAYEYSLVLPVTISSFTAKLNNNRTNLNWSVGTENNVSHYEVERSQNGLDFSNIATVKANGSSAYSTTDNSPSLGVNYYRLKTVDKDGSAVYYNKVVSVNVADLSATLIGVYPNPARDIVKVSGLAQGNYSYKLVNTAGATVQQGILDAEASINVSGLKAGMYVLQLSNGTQLKLIKR